MHTAHNCTVHKSLHYTYIASNGRLVLALAASLSTLGLCYFNSVPFSTLLELTNIGIVIVDVSLVASFD